MPGAYWMLERFANSPQKEQKSIRRGVFMNPGIPGCTAGKTSFLRGLYPRHAPSGA